MTALYCPIPEKTAYILRISQLFSKPSKQIWYNGGAILVHEELIRSSQTH